MFPNASVEKDPSSRYDGETGQALIGAVIQAVQIDEDLLTFQAGDRVLSYNVEGDCCSHSYFAELHNVNSLFSGFPILSVDEIELKTFEHLKSSNKSWSRDEVASVYGFRIGYGEEGPAPTILVFRNSSNGYYGGWMNFGGESEGQIPEVNRITSDWICDY